ncbi:MAG: peptide chain release factor 1 [Gammaproteobacteria bacterium RIFCSPHIGHO2_12_FULL_37_14]|nr:MAG: peptide chain release factor 1 [Gammaproteobacteria bacterium RIFCSPHIGHO2_12_FULL_37_14]
MLENIEALRARFNELSDKLLSPSLESSERRAFQREHSYLSDILIKSAEIEDVNKKLRDAQVELASAEDDEFKQLFKEEIEQLKSRLSTLEKELEDVLFPSDELDSSSAFIEIRAGAGGQEAALFASDLLRMYTNYALKKGWNPEVVSASETDLKGFKEVILHIKGRNAYRAFKYESGVHRVQRVPATETSGRVHTSTITVAVFPEVPDDLAIEISPDDLRIDVYRSSGAGGQHVNTTDSAVRITHIPTGVVVACQDERSQHKNKAKALKVLKSRLVTEQRRKQEEEEAKKRKEQVGRGMRAEKARTYNYPQNRVTDHAAEVTFNNLDFIIEGEMDKLINALQEKEKEERRKHPPVFAKASPGEPK